MKVVALALAVANVVLVILTPSGSAFSNQYHLGRAISKVFRQSDQVNNFRDSCHLPRPYYVKPLQLASARRSRLCAKINGDDLVRAYQARNRGIPPPIPEVTTPPAPEATKGVISTSTSFTEQVPHPSSPLHFPEAVTHGAGSGVDDTLVAEKTRALFQLTQDNIHGAVHTTSPSALWGHQFADWLTAASTVVTVWIGKLQEGVKHIGLPDVDFDISSHLQDLSRDDLRIPTYGPLYVLVAVMAYTWGQKSAEARQQQQPFEVSALATDTPAPWTPPAVETLAARTLAPLTMAAEMLATEVTKWAESDKLMAGEGDDDDGEVLFMRERLAVSRVKKDGRHVLVGSIETTFRRLWAPFGEPQPHPLIETEPLILSDDNKKTRNEHQDNQDTIPEAQVVEKEKEEDPVVSSFTNLVQSRQVELQLIVAMDFTASNGDPTTPGTFHYVDPSDLEDRHLNPYERVLAGVGSVWDEWHHGKNDDDVNSNQSKKRQRRHPHQMWGFGAQIPGAPDGEISQRFVVSGPSGALPSSITELHETYHGAPLVVKPGEPTGVVTDIVEAAAKLARKQLEQSSTYTHTVLLLVTNGRDVDVDVAAGLLENRATTSANTPLSVFAVDVSSLPSSSASHDRHHNDILNNLGAEEATTTTTTTKSVLPFVDVSCANGDNNTSLGRAIFSKLPARVCKAHEVIAERGDTLSKKPVVSSKPIVTLLDPVGEASSKAPMRVKVSFPPDAVPGAQIRIEHPLDPLKTIVVTVPKAMVAGGAMTVTLG